jgi:hypothetical protein
VLWNDPASTRPQLVTFRQLGGIDAKLIGFWRAIMEVGRRIDSRASMDEALISARGKAVCSFANRFVCRQFQARPTCDESRGSTLHLQSMSLDNLGEQDTWHGGLARSSTYQKIVTGMSVDVSSPP